ncbi:hypothetical protein ACWGOQ_0016385 [Aquimarina sp. M1]
MRDNYYTIICYLFLLALFTNCSGNSNAPILTTPEGLEAIKNKLENTFDKDKQIIRLSFHDRSNSLEIVGQFYIFFPENNKEQIWFYDYVTGQLYKPESKQDLKDKPKTKAVSAFNMDESSTYFNQAVALIEKETDEFSNYRIHRYEMSVDQTSGKITHYITLNTDKKTRKRTFYGKKIDNNYLYQFQFKTNEDGNLVATAGLDVFDK